MTTSLVNITINKILNLINLEASIRVLFLSGMILTFSDREHGQEMTSNNQLI